MDTRSCRFTAVLLAATLFACTEAQETVAPKDGNVYGWANDASGQKHGVKHGVVAAWSFTPAGESHAVHFLPGK